MTGSGEWKYNKNINSWISEVKQYEETMANKQSKNGRGEHQINEITMQKEVPLNAYICAQMGQGLNNRS